jgi:hypothetical protein
MMPGGQVQNEAEKKNQAAEQVYVLTQESVKASGLGLHLRIRLEADGTHRISSLDEYS